MMQQIKKIMNRVVLVTGFTALLIFIQTPLLAHAQTPAPSEPSSSAFEPSGETECESEPLTPENCGILKLVVTISNILSAIAGVVIVMMLIVGGIQYSAAGSNPQAVAAAKGRMRNALIALFVFTFMYAFLQWIIPGGLFS